MKRVILVLCAVLMLFGCTKNASNRYTSSVFDAVLPESFERVATADIICFAPYGDPLLSSSITFYTTELNWYFDTFTAEEYEQAMQTLCGYEALTLSEIQDCRVDGFDAKRIACKVQIDQGMHDLILYAVHADHTYFFTLLNRETDSYIDAFDEMIRTIDLKGMQE